MNLNFKMKNNRLLITIIYYLLFKDYFLHLFTIQLKHLGMMGP